MTAQIKEITTEPRDGVLKTQVILFRAIISRSTDQKQKTKTVYQTGRLERNILIFLHIAFLRMKQGYWKNISFFFFFFRESKLISITKDSLSLTPSKHSVLGSLVFWQVQPGGHWSCWSWVPEYVSDTKIVPPVAHH